MLKVYVRDNCAFCGVVLDALKEMKIAAEIKDGRDKKAAEEIIAGGGKLQFPFLLDEEYGVGLYEADLIVEYLETMYGSAKSNIKFQKSK
jgi:glutaredoxin